MHGMVPRNRRVRTRLATGLASVALVLGATGCFDGEGETIDRESVELTPDDTAGIERITLQAEDGVTTVVAEDRDTILVDVRYRAWVDEGCGWGKKGWKHHGRDDDDVDREAIREQQTFDLAIDGTTLALWTTTGEDGRVDLDLVVPQGIEVDVAAMTDDVQVRDDGVFRVQLTEAE